MAAKKQNVLLKIIKLIALQLVLIIVFSALLIYHGPFTKLRNSIVETAMNTHSQQYWATWFLSKQEIDNILSKSQAVVQNGVQNVDAVSVNSEISVSPNGSAPTSGVTVEDISGKGFVGKMMIIPDPSKITVGVSSKIGHSGDKLSDMVANSNALGGINAGGFLDDNFVQNGGIPAGIVISNGQVLSQQIKLTKFSIVGFNTSNVLIVSNGMTLQQISDAKLRCAVSFGPALVVNGQNMVSYSGTDLEPRTVIGQKKDGTVLMMTIDGRQSSSAGATEQAAALMMIKYGAYNAANLDGGSSTTMCFNKQVVNSPCDMLGERSIATSFLVMP